MLWIARLIASPVVFAAVPSAADSPHGRISGEALLSRSGDSSLGAALVDGDRKDANGNLRLAWTPRRGPWRFDIAYQLNLSASDAPELRSRMEALELLPTAPPASAWDGTDTIVNDRRFSAVQRMDRFSVGYTGQRFILRIGRQALTWGGGFVFHPMDLFDPFSPDATDVEFKLGTDMAYAQYLFDDGADFQFVAVPRPG